MKRQPVILLCWEGGAGVGHATRLKRIASALGERGAFCIVALFDQRFLSGFADVAGEALLAPQERIGKDRPPPLKLSPEPRDHANFTKYLWELGFWRRLTILANIKSWDKIFKQVKPDIIVADFSPYALLAAAGRIPTVAVGHGFFIPALVDGYFSPDGQAASRQDKAAQAKIFVTVAKACAMAGLGEHHSIAQALCGDMQCPATLPAIDPRYALRPDVLVPPEIDALPDVGSSHGKEILVYMGEDSAGHAPAIAAVASAGLKVIVYARPGSKCVQADRLPGTVEIRDYPFTPQEISTRAALIVHHGGAGMTHLCALSGVPQLIAYRGYERWNNATAVWRMGAGAGFPLESLNPEQFGKFATRFSGSGSHRDAALNWVKESREWIQGRRGQDVIADRVIDLIRATRQSF